MASKSYELLLHIGGKTDPSVLKSVNSAAKSLDSIKKSANLVKNALGAALGVVSIGKVVDFGKSCIEAAAPAEQAVSQLDTVLASTKGVSGMTADGAVKIADSLSGVTTFSRSAVLSTEDLLLTFTKVGKNIMPDATEAVLNMSQALGQDTKAGAIQLGKALNDPITGMTALRRVGVAFTADQQKQIKALVQSGKTLDAQKLILSELNTEFGGSAKAAAKTAEGQKILLQNQVTDLKASVGEELVPIESQLVSSAAKVLPAIRPVLQFVAGGVATLSEKVIPVLSDKVAGAAGWIQSHMPQIKNVLSETFSTAQAVISKMASVAERLLATFSKHPGLLKALLVGVLGVVAAIKVFTAAQGILNAVMNMNPILRIISIIYLLVAAFLYLWDNCAAFRNFWIGLWNGIRSASEAVMNWFPSAWITVAGAFKSAWTGIGDWFKGLWDGVTGVFEGVMNFFIDGINNIIGGVNKVAGIGKIVGLNVQIPTIPRLASGGIVQHRPGGVLTNIAEGRYDEAVVPLRGGPGGLGSFSPTFAPVINIYGGASKQDVAEALTDAQAEWERKMAVWQRNQRRVSFANG